ncbi:DNA helicase PcrA [Mycolicibacterium sp. F2034L]|uniref:DNA helicase PcrA n=1 Tax=Mycolicibacterium sp. F2034L TaxID=2926422 RepID=UPI001FF425D0|nr:DNA helicase PcrA [Mycolicibacterium sp. F2034L]MCK0172791.1 DNA helicase PcrA [Mycolicibacterium sp. F2034L]
MSVHVTEPRSGLDEAPERLLDGLNPQQRQAVLHEGTPLLIVAGAGSGKTAVLTRRIAYLLAARDVGVGQVLAITFTNKAAAEMRERVAALVGPRARSMWVSTFHSTCVRILRNQASLLPGLNSNFSIYDADDSRRLLLMIGKDMGLDTKRYSPRLLSNGISNLKNELIGPEQAAAEASEAEEDLARIIADVYAEYQKRLRAANALDFDDLIGETVAVLQRFPQIAQYYRRRFRHILVDEYQDTNHAQYMLVRELVGHDLPEDDGVPPAELCVVGDADQSIYAFRGATIRNIEDFERDYPNATTILLEQNYRSTQTILNAANSVIARNSGRREKRLWTDSGQGELIVGYVADNEHDEARFVAQEIDRLADSRDSSAFNYSDFAVFYRTNNSSRALEEVFIRAGIPYKVVGGVRFYERREIRDIVAYLRVLDNPGDSVSMRRILNTPRRGIGDRAEACVAVYAENTGGSFNDALQAAAEGKVPMLNTRSEKCIKSFVDMLNDLRGKLGDELGELVEAVLDRTGYRTELEASSDPQDLARLDNLNELVSVAHEFSIDRANAAALAEELDEPVDEDVPDTGVLAQFLERVSLVADADDIPEHGSGVVTMMTLHTAKGLEFPVVFVTGWEDGMFPHMRALGDPTELSEERRLAYVGITRARQRLYLSRAKVRSSWGQPMLNPESRFLREIPQELIDWRRTDPTPSYSAPVSGAGRFGTPRPSPARASAGKRPLIVLEPGDRVTHDKYGLGRVEEVSGVGESAMSLIDFGSAGRVKLMHNHAPVQKL